MHPQRMNGHDAFCERLLPRAQMVLSAGMNERIESVLAGLVARCSAVRGRVSCPLIASLQEAT